MEIQRKTMSMASEDRLSDLPDEILIHILSRVWYEKQVVRTSILSTRWRFLWTFVPVSLEFYYRYDRDEKNILDIIASVHAELYHWRCCKKIRTFRLCDIKYEKRYVEHFDIWVHFATKVANVEDFSLQIDYTSDTEIYEFPQFAYKNTWLKKVVLKNCQLNPFSGSVNWTSLVKLSVGDIELADGVMEKVLSGCPNLERLTLDDVWGFRRLEITSAKLRKLNIVRVNPRDGLDILAPYIQYLKVSDVGLGIHFNLASLVTAVLHLHYSDFQDDEDKMEEQCSYLKELLHSLAHVHNLELDPWCIECLSILELQGWQSPPSHWKFVKLNTALEELDFPGICSFLQSSSHLETLVINWSNCARIDLLSRYTNKDEQHRRFETHNFDYSLRHLKTIEIIIFRGPLSKNMFIGSLVKFFLKNATVLEKFIIAGKFKGSDVSQDYVKMEQEFLSFPRSSPHASVVFSYQ